MIRAGRSLKPFRHPWLWSLLWVCGIAGVIVFTLLPPRDMPPMPVQVSDKLEHFTAYFLLMAGSVQIHAKRLSWIGVALMLVAMGVGLEFLQGAMHAGRSQDMHDALANTLGVIAGFATGFTPLRDLLLRLDGGRRIARVI